LRSVVSPGGQHGRHHEVLGARDGDSVEVHHRAAKAFRGAGFDVAMRLADARAKLFQPENVQVDGPVPDGAATRQRNARAPATGHQRPQHQARGAHGLHQFVRRFGTNDLRRMEPHRLTLRLYRRSDIHQQPLDSPDIPHARNALQDHRLFG
jgi:hypothetical protein